MKRSKFGELQIVFTIEWAHENAQLGGVPKDKVYLGLHSTT
ncbi:hypothetical protein ACEZ3G_02350 [Maribacter algicola]|uniref:Uncharacterized protein n=1 Tax=Meishania litoralis TaxID=3434685 RepID=A0ACC7LFY6_9FLAO